MKIMKKILILSLFLLVACQSNHNQTSSEVSTSGAHLGGVQGGGTESDRQPVESGMGQSSK